MITLIRNSGARIRMTSWRTDNSINFGTVKIPADYGFRAPCFFISLSADQPDLVLRFIQQAVSQPTSNRVFFFLLCLGRTGLGVVAIRFLYRRLAHRALHQ
jgi:hypothetical protein